MPWGRVAGASAAATAGALAARFAAGRNRAERSWPAEVAPRLINLGEVDWVSILPLVERLVADAPEHPGVRLGGEPGVSYLLRTDKSTLLFDVGLNPRARARSVLVANADTLGVDLGSLDGVVISHLHPDHVGGLASLRRRTFSFAAEPLEQRGLPACVPTQMRHDRADVLVTTAPRVIAPGVAVLPPLPRMLFLLGPVVEQALVVNVRGFGLVLVAGCGHPPIDRMLGVAEQVLDVPIRAVVGGLHLPVHPLGTPLILQAVLGLQDWPWRPAGERDVAAVIEAISERGPRVVALSSHDSTPWTYDAFARAFGERYRTLRVGEELRIGSPDALQTTPPGPSTPNA
jgi:7,8-dihydropterin-6-yl-methyl-4-(beta-D-ribofuranosyl)aminobenzene 5'-phosphate synthase